MLCKKMLIICLTRMNWKVYKTVDVDLEHVGGELRISKH